MLRPHCNNAVFLLPAVALLACKLPGKNSDPVAPASASVTAPPAPPAPAAMIQHSSGLLSAPKPSGDGWDCGEQAESGKGASVRLVKCRRLAEGEFFFMMAKSYDVPQSEVMSAEQLVQGPFRKNYEKLFERVTIVESRPLVNGGKSWFQIQIEANHASRGQIHKVERVHTKGARVFIVSAEGNPKQFERFASDRATWLSHTTFSDL